MNPAEFALQKRTLMVVLTIMLIIAGMLSYKSLGRLEDPTFTIKTALVVTPYPGAGPKEVEEEVTDLIEEAIQSMGQVKRTYSTSRQDISIVYVDMKDEYQHEDLAQIWDELRKKIRDVRGGLPPGAGPSIVNDDFGDVYGVFFALTCDSCTHRELKDYAQALKTELLLCEEVAKISFWGINQEVIYVDFARARISELGLSPSMIMNTLQTQNIVSQSGQVKVGERYLRISPTGGFSSVRQIRELKLGSADGLVRLGDVADVYRGYTEPPQNMMRYNGKPAIGLGISTVDGGNVITMGESIKEKLKTLAPNRPEGIHLHTIYYQSENVIESVNTFALNLFEAVAIVVVLLMLFMGWQSGMLIGGILVLNILATFIGMMLMDIDLQKVSLGALILALGMLVDNAIVVADGILVRVERGEDREKAAVQTVRDTRWPLLGATFVAILAFAAIGFAPGDVGEFCRSLFDVMAMSLLISWVLAVTITPLFCVWFLKAKADAQDPHKRWMYRVYRKFLHQAVRFRWITVMVTLLLLFAAFFGFRYVPKAFFPDSTMRYFFVNYWKPEGTHIRTTSEDMKKIEDYVHTLEGVKNITSFVGEGALRFILPYDYQSPNASYGQLLVEVEDYHLIDRMREMVDAYLAGNFPDAEPYTKNIPNGPPVTYKIEVRFRGPNPVVLHDLSEKALAVFRNHPNTTDIRTDWRNTVCLIRPEFSETQARFAGVSRQDLSMALEWNFNGIPAGLYREKDELIPIVFRPPQKERESVSNLENVQVWSSIKNTFIPIRQVVKEVKPSWEYPLIQRRNRLPTITVQCNPKKGLPDPLRNALAAEIESIPLETGYSMEWGGEYESSKEAQEPLKKVFPICLIAMFVIVVWLFNSIRRPAIIFLTVPLSLIGVSAGLLITQLPFGFMSILGFLGLSGMLIKNAIVLIDQIQLELTSGSHPYRAILDAAVSRLRPVLMAAGTTILGMAPLITSPMYSAMAATIMSGLFMATFLTLIIVPVLYTLFYRILPDNQHV